MSEPLLCLPSLVFHPRGYLRGNQMAAGQCQARGRETPGPEAPSPEEQSLALGGWLLGSGGNLSRISFQCDPQSYMAEQQTKESTLVVGEGCVWILKFVTLHTI